MAFKADAERELRLDEIVLAYVKALETDAGLDQQSWLDRYPDLKDELVEFFHDQKRIDQLAGMLRRLTEVAETLGQSSVTVSWQETGAKEPVDSELPSQHNLGNYEILEEIGKGGMGRVYKARQRSLKRIVALKMILGGAHAGEELLQRFRSEAEAVARLQHPNIVQIYEVGELDGMPFISLEFLEGGSLATHLDGTPMPLRPAAQLVRTLAQAIHFAHKRGIIHRDLKPANILLGARPGQQTEDSEPSGEASTLRSSSASASRMPAPVLPKITDFGLAKRLDEESGQTKSGTIMGTPSYMAPEQAGGQRNRIGPAADVYGLGAILYEALTGRPPFKAATSWETVHQVLHNEAVAPRLLDPNINRDLETICLKCLQKDPERRYDSAQALADDLGRYLEGRPILARPVSRLSRFWRLCRRHPGTSLSLALALLFLLGMLVAIAIFNTRLQGELAQNEALNHDLQMSLTRQVAARIDGDLRQLSRAPTAMAGTLSLRSDWSEDQLEALLRQMIEKDERVYGMTIALEPRQFDGEREDFALYVYRGAKGLQAKSLLPPDSPNYKPYREQPWYKDAKIRKRATWSEPFFDADGGDITMLTYSAPIWRKGNFAGVVTADLSIAYFAAMRQWLDDLKLGANGYGFVISPTGTFISHPDPAFQMPVKITEVPAFREDEALRDLTKRLLNGESGHVHAVDPSTGKLSEFYFAPIATAQWSFVAVSKR